MTCQHGSFGHGLQYNLSEKILSNMKQISKTASTMGTPKKGKEKSFKKIFQRK
jgi:hypothetical protein